MLTLPCSRCECRTSGTAFTGAACEIPTCPTEYKNCNPETTDDADTRAYDHTAIRGQCLEGVGKCQCNPPFAGEYCHLFECDAAPAAGVCSLDLGRGECDPSTGRCKCFEEDGRAKFDLKTACATLMCAGSNAAVDCSGAGVCGPDGNCQCEPGFDGAGCEQAVANPAHIAAGVISALICVMCCAVLVFCFLRQRAIAELQKH